MCDYCDPNRAGKEFKVNKTDKLKLKNNSDNLDYFILYGGDGGVGLMIGTFEGYHYIDINYCPMCGRKISTFDLLNEKEIINAKI